MLTTAPTPSLMLYFADPRAWSAVPDAALLRQLPAVEQARARGYWRDGDRRRFALARVLLRQLLSARLRQPADEINLVIDALGKPRLANASTDGPHFNLSHSERRIAIAIADAPVGIDVEAWPPAPAQRRAIASLALSEDERATLPTLPQAMQTPALLAAWVGKEALLKAEGGGLRREPERFSLGDGWAQPLAPLERAAWQARTADDELPALHWQCGWLDEKHLAAVALIGGAAAPAVRSQWLCP